MTSQFEYSSTLNSEEIEQLKGILAQCFGTSITNLVYLLQLNCN